MTDSLVLALAQATWYRCRSLQERKEGATWDTIPTKYRQAWVDGATADLRAANLVLQRDLLGSLFR